MSSETAPFITGQRTFKTTLGALGALIGLVCAGVLAWASLRGDVDNQARTVERHEYEIKVVKQRLDSDHDILIEIRSDLKALRREQTR